MQHQRNIDALMQMIHMYETWTVKQFLLVQFYDVKRTPDVKKTPLYKYVLFDVDVTSISCNKLESLHNYQNICLMLRNQSNMLNLAEAWYHKWRDVLLSYQNNLFWFARKYIKKEKTEAILLPGAITLCFRDEFIIARYNEMGRYAEKPFEVSAFQQSWKNTSE